MSSLKIFLKSNDFLASYRLLILTMLVSPALQILFISALASGSMGSTLPKNLLFVAASTVISFAITLFSTSVFMDRVNRIYSTQLVGRSLTRFLLPRFALVWLFSMLMALVVLILLFLAEALSPLSSLTTGPFSSSSLVAGSVVTDSRLLGGQLTVGSTSDTVFPLEQKILLLLVVSFGSCAIGLFFNTVGLFFNDPYRLVNWMLPFLPVLMPILVPRHQLPWLFYLFSWLLPGNFVMNALQSGRQVLWPAVAADLGLSVAYLLLGLLIGEQFLKHVAWTGGNEQPF